MTEQEFRDKYNSLLHEFNEKYGSNDRLQNLIHDKTFTDELKRSKSNEETIAIVGAKLLEVENDRTNNLVGFMLKKFLDVKD